MLCMLETGINTVTPSKTRQELDVTWSIILSIFNEWTTPWDAGKQERIKLSKDESRKAFSAQLLFPLPPSNLLPLPLPREAHELIESKGALETLALRAPASAKAEPTLQTSSASTWGSPSPQQDSKQHVPSPNFNITLTSSFNCHAVQVIAENKTL